MAVPQDGKPISKYPNQNDAFLEIVQAIRRILKEVENQPDHLFQKPKVSNKSSEQLQNFTNHKPRSSNLRIKKRFAQQDKDIFLEQSYQYIANYFENSLEELQSRYLKITTKYKRVDTNHFTAKIYNDGKTVSECRIWLEEGDRFTGSIRYAHSSSIGDNSYNESMSVEDDGYMIFLKPMGMSFRKQGEKENRHLSQEGASEYFWEMLVENLQ